MFYYRITDTSDGSEQFLKPSDARKFLNLEDSALKAYADIPVRRLQPPQDTPESKKAAVD